MARRRWIGRCELRPTGWLSVSEAGPIHGTGNLVTMRSLLAGPARAMRRLGVPVPTRGARPRSHGAQRDPIPARESVPRAHFLHVGKTGGTAVKTALEPLAGSGPFTLMLHKHPFTLAKVPDGEVFFFALRDPIERFVSGFYCRQRQGWPRYHQPWSPYEKLAFARFTSANALALALSSPDEDERVAAERAMRSVQHLGSVWRWFGNEEEFKAREPFLLKVLFADQLDQDFNDLVGKLGLEAFHPVLPHDDVNSYRAPSNPDPLDDEAVESLRRWYRRDYEFLELCRNLQGRRERGSDPTLATGEAPAPPA
jgi:hypothetical protein